MIGSNVLHRAAFDQNLSLIGLLETSEQTQGRRLPGPTGADEGKKFARLDGKRAVIHRQSGAVVFDEISYFDARGTQGGTTTCWTESGIRVCPLTDAQAVLVLPDHLAAQQFSILCDDANESIRVFRVIAHQLGEFLNLALQSIQPPKHFLQPSRRQAVFRSTSRLYRHDAFCHLCLLQP
jgi:hypothetical protein